MTCIILDPGHGGISPGGYYLTNGKQSPQVPPGIYEGEFNRDIAHRVQQLLTEMDIESVITAPSAMSPRESDRVKYANALHAKRGDCVYVAIHANAEPLPWKEWGKANGATIFVNRYMSWRGWALSRGGEPIARKVIDEIGLWTNINIDRGVKGRRFYVLNKTKMLAILIECAFMTNLKDAVLMASDEGRQLISVAIAHGLREALK